MAGKVTVITGPMRSSKTLDVIVMAKEAEYAGKKVQAYHPAISSRWDDNAIVSRLNVSDEDSTRLSFPSSAINNIATDFFPIFPVDTDIVIFDDVQFFGDSVVEIVKWLRSGGIDVYICGLDVDCFQQPFGPMPFLMAIADQVIKKTTFCRECGDVGQISYRQVDNKEQVLVGDNEYITLCYDCWYDRKEEEELKLNFKLDEGDDNHGCKWWHD